MLRSLHRFFVARPHLLLAMVVGITLITFVITLLPVDNIVPQRALSYDKIAHVLIFGGWTFILGYYRLLTRTAWHRLGWVCVSGIAFGALVEVLQHFLPFGRHGDLYDLLFDAVGSVLALLILYKIKRLLQVELKN